MFPFQQTFAYSHLSQPELGCRCTQKSNWHLAQDKQEEIIFFQVSFFCFSFFFFFNLRLHSKHSFSNCNVLTSPLYLSIGCLFSAGNSTTCSVIGILFPFPRGFPLHQKLTLCCYTSAFSQPSAWHQVPFSHDILTQSQEHQGTPGVPHHNSGATLFVLSQLLKTQHIFPQKPSPAKQFSKLRKKNWRTKPLVNIRKFPHPFVKSDWK